MSNINTRIKVESIFPTVPVRKESEGLKVNPMKIDPNQFRALATIPETDFEIKRSGVGLSITIKPRKLDYL